MTVSSSDAQRGEIDEDTTSGAVTLEVTLSESSTEAVTVAYATADFASTDTAVSSSSIDPATAGADYTAASGTLTFAAGETRKTITVAISDDVNRERDELFKVGLSSATGGASIASTGSEATILIDDDDPQPKATITASVPGLTSTGAPGATRTAPEGFLSVAEGDSGNTDITFTVTLEATNYLRTTFFMANSTTLGSATVDEDYMFPSSSPSLNIAAGQTTGTFTLPIIGDENYESDETLFLSFFHESLRTVITNSAANAFLVEVTITNDDPVMPTSASNLRARPAGSGNLAVSWDPALGAPNGYSVRWRKASESDTALSAVNTVTATSYTITGLDNDTSYHVRLDTRNLANDGIASGTSLTTAATPTAGAAPTVTAIANQSARVGEPFEVDVDATPGTAGDSLQYQAASSAPAVATVTPTALTAHSASSTVRVTPVAAGTATITVTVSDGTEVGTETFDVTVSQPTLSIAPVAGNGVTVSSSDAQRGEIDEDATSGAVTLKVTLSESSTEAVTVAYATADFSSTDTAVSSSSIDPATAGTDYSAASGTLTFAAGETRKTITVSISDDVNRERDELFKVGLSSATGGASIASTGSEATILIDDDDPRPKATITASVPGLTSTGAPGATRTTPEGFLSVAEGDSGNTDITFTVTLEATNYLRTTFFMANSTTLGSATVDEDYMFPSSSPSLNIAAGQTTGTFTLPIIGDENYESDETLFLSFFHESLRTVITNSAANAFLVEVTITNDDPVMATSASNLQARPAGSGNLAVFWDPALGAPNGYSVRWRKASESDTALSAVNIVTATSYTITGLDNDTSYHVRLDTRNLANDGIASNTSLTTAATPTAGAAPTVTAIANQSARVGQPFDVDVDATPGTAGDSLQYQAASSAPAVATVTPTALTAHDANSQVRVTPVAAGTATITVTVSDGTEVGTETFDVTVSAVTLGYSAAPPTLTVDTPITALTATATGFGSATVSYAVTTGTLPAGLNISATTGAITGTPTAASTTTTTVTVTATAGTGMDTQTATADITFPAVDKGTLAKPTNLAVKANSNTRTGFTVTWDAVPNAAGYTATAVQGSNSFTGTVSTSGTTPEAEFTGLTANTAYTVTVTATGDANYSMSEASDEFDVTTAANQVPTVGTAIPDQTATVDTAFEYSFPAGTFSDADSDSLTYTATRSDDSALPTWLSFTASERKLAGTPQSGDIGTLMVKVTASDGMGGSVSDTFDIVVSVADTAPAFASSATIADKTFTVDAEITAFTLPEATGGNGTISYALTPDLPTGLSLDESTREVSGTPTAAAAEATYTWRASDSDSNTANSDSSTLTFMLTVNKATLATPSNLGLKANTQSKTGFTVSWTAVTNATGYTATATPSGGTAVTGTVSVPSTGPEAVFTGLTAGTTYTVSVVATGNTANYEASTAATLNQATAANSAPTVANAIPDQTATTGTAFSFTLPAGTFSDADSDSLTYTAQQTDGTTDSALPTWLSFTAGTGVFSGTPTSTDAGTLSVKVTASDGTDSVSDTFDIVVSAADTAPAFASSTTIADKTFTVDAEITAFTLPEATGGNGTISYALTPDLSAGLSVDTGTREVSGTPTAAAAAATYTWRASDGDANTANSDSSALTFMLTVNKATLATPVVTVSAQDGKLTATWPDVVNAASYEVEYKESTSDTWLGNDDDTSSAEIDSLTNGTEYDVRVRAKAASSSTNYEDSAWSDVAKGTPVAADVAPSFGSETIAAQTWTVGTEVDVTLPAATGGNGTVSYALTPALPNGVSLDATTRKVSGTPTAVASAATYTWRASDSDSNTANTDTAALTFSVTVGKATLATPSNLGLKTNTRSKTGFTVTWDAVTNATGYTATATPSGGTAVTGTVSVPSTGPEAVFTGLTAGTTYTVSVVATGNTANYEASTAATLSQATSANSAPTVATEIPDQTATTGTAFSFTLPAGTFSDADSGDSLTYTAQQTDGTTDSALPTWLSFTAGTGVFSGTPTSTDAGTLIVKVTASDGTASASDTFDIVVSAADTAPAFASGTTIADKTFTVDTEITAFTLPEATGGNGIIGYALTPNLPTGLSLDTSTREVSGTPTAAAAQATYTWRASDGDSNTANTDTATLTFSVTVNKATLATPSNLALKANTRSKTGFTVTWDAVSNATGYTATAVQGSNTFTGAVTGTEATFTGLAVNTTYTVSVVATGNTVNYESSTAATLSQATAANSAPTVATEIPDQTATTGTAFSFTLLTGTFSDADSGDSLTYTAQQTDGTTDSALPTWLSFTAGTGVFSGTPTSTDAGTLMVKVTANDGTASVSDTFDIVVSAADTAPAFASGTTIADKTFTVDAEITAFTLPEATGGNGTISYALTPDLPTGLSLDTSTREVSGTPTAAAAEATYTWRASDSDSNTANSDSSALTFMLTVNKATLATPSNLALKAGSRSKTGFTVSWTAVPNATGYTATATPSGGTAVTGTVTGTEATFTGLSVNTTYTVSVVATGNTANYEASTAATLSQATAANSAPTVANAIPDQTATTGTAFSFTLPTGTFSDADSGDSLTYTVMQTDGTTDSALPTWLSFTAGTGVFSGTPTSTDTGTLSVKVTASDGTDSVSDTFDIVVSVADTAPAFASGTIIADKTFTVDAEITAFTLPEATGGNGTISYALTPELPTGLSLDTSTREVSGTPTAVATATTYTWRASDSDSNTANSDTAALTFQVTVVDAVPIITPTQVSNLRVSAGDGSLEVSWTAASVAPNGYSVRWRERGPGNALTPVNRVTGTSFTIPDLINGQEYVVRVETRTAADDDVQGGTVVTATGTPVEEESVVTPTQVSNLQVSAGDGSLDVSWTAASVAPNGYSVRWREKGPGNALTPVNEVDGTSFTISDLINGQEYVVRIETRTAVDDGVQGGTVVTATGVPVEDEVAPPPPPPTPTPPAVDDRGLPTVSIEDASAMEGDDLEFRVVLSKAVRHRVKVYWATRPGTATAGRDYKSAAGAVVFRPGVTERRIRVRTMEDSHNDPDETMQVRLSSPRGVLIEDGRAVGRINNWDALPVAWLARFGRAVTEQALEGVEQRLTAPREAGTRGTLAGMTLAGLTTSNFTHTGAMDAAGGSLAFWGRGARADFRGLDGVVHLDGQTETVTLGADYARDAWLTGIMLTRSRGTGGYQGVASGEVEVSLNAAIPYGSYRFSERLDVWGAVGRGTGALTLTPEGEGSIEADLDWSMVSAGLRGGLFGAAGHGPAVTLVSDVLWSRTGSGRVEAGEEHSSLASSEADTSRLRLGLEGSWALTLGNVGAVTPKLEAGVRHDDGDAGQGFGVEVGGGLAWTLPALGVTLDVSGRTLVTHEDDGQEAHGFSAALNFDPSVASTRGFTLNLRQDIGGPSSGGVQALFASEFPGVGNTGMGGGSMGVSADSRWTLETAYGLAAYDDRFTLSPTFGLAASDTSVDFHLGWQLMPELSEDALNLSLTFKVTRRELLNVGTVNSIDSIGTLQQGPEHGVHMEVSARW